MVTEIWVNFGSDNDLLSDGAKPLLEPMLSNRQGGGVGWVFFSYGSVLHRSYIILTVVMRLIGFYANMVLASVALSK